MEYLEHHGVKGMKWGVRRYQNYDGSRIKSGSLVLKKGEKLYRYSNKKETGSLRGAYAMRSVSDIKEYFIDAKETRIGFKEYDKIYMSEITVKEAATIKRGRAVVEDIVKEIGDKKLSDAFAALDKVGYLDDTKSAYERSIIWQNNGKKVLNARADLASAINKHLYKKETSEKSREATIQKYLKAGYDAITDAEDFVWNYETPMILLNPDKFERTRTDVVYNKTSKQHDKEVEAALKKGEDRLKVLWTDVDMKTINDFIDNKKGG